jgi:hypothetical protein
MTAHNPPPAAGPWRYAPAAAALVLLGVGLHLYVRQDNEWEKVFVTAAARLRDGDLYRAGTTYLYPPFTAWATLPFVWLSHDVGRLAFVTLNLGCVIFLLRGAWRLAGGGLLDEPAERWAALWGAVCGIFYLHNCLVHQQTDVIIAALLVGGCLALARGRDLLGATGLGLAAAMKCTALLWVPYLLWRRRPAAAGWLVAVALGVNLLPDLVSRPPSGGTWLGEFGSRFLRPLADRDHVPGSWGSDIVFNQSLSGAAQRWLMTAPRWGADDCTVERSGASVSPLTVRGLLLAVEAVLLLLAAHAFGRPLRPAADRDREPLEYSVVLLLMLLLSPMSSMAHFGTLVLPGFCLARRAVGRRDRVLIALLLAAATLALASNKDLLGGRLYTVALWGGCVMLNTLLLLAGCLRELGRKEGASAAPARALRPAA